MLERDFHRVLQICAAINLRSTATAAALTCPTKYLTKNIAKRIAKPGTARATHASRVRIDASVSVTIVSRTLVFIGENFIRLFGLFEFLFGFLAIGIAVGMVFHRQLAIGLFQVLIRCVFGNTKGFVEVAFCHDLRLVKR